MEGGQGVDEARPDQDFPADPYPGIAPGWSFVHDDATARRLTPDPGAAGGWRVGGRAHEGRALDAWLAARGAPPLARRVPVLAFGSNRCPSKITWLRRELGLAGPVVVLRAAVSGVAAVWAAGRRARDGARPATLAVVPPDEPPEVHGVWLATPEQVAVLDVCEGRGRRYALARVHAARVRGTDDGVALDPVLAYWPADAIRAPLLVDGAPVRCRDVAQERAITLEGVPGDVADGAATVIPSGSPDPRAWPARVFVYGTLQPGASAWWRLAPAARETWPAVAAGRVHDTGRGYPALVRDAGVGDALAPGHVVELADPVAALPALDAYEGPGYRRERVAVYRAANAADRSAAAPATAASGSSSEAELCWAWIWDGPAGDWPVVHGSWRG
ncbi:gamma-glutamylcyclotransferase family protein [Actinomycetospora sp. TBRC 11914]|uniref:gamma-glutamylcyclotransferase family protein n=1 Tax=Actinomycetospora sp. TBRC 11914 TaxID=2729387 RepID=UPI00145C4A1F|nr:gamma-glutamylcyclotransferase family protein [Actinomycetospora sp. TBRC 11914]NMO92456.1 gamma-glutamylcyclotransferase [Actinomycetospora sp. TBRC 11914]